MHSTLLAPASSFVDRADQQRDLAEQMNEALEMIASAARSIASLVSQN